MLFRGPELSPGDDVQTDEQLDNFVRNTTHTQYKLLDPFFVFFMQFMKFFK